MRVLSWNVNGLRACAKKGFGRWLKASEGAIVGLQEVRARREQVPAEVAQAPGWEFNIVAAQRPGYSGVGLFSRRTPDSVSDSLGEPRFDREGRVQIARFGRLRVVNVYFPNGSGQDRDNSRVAYKLDFYRHLFERLQRLRRSGARVLVMGDFNTAHRPIDLARPGGNAKTSGFLPEERAEMERWMERGWIDTYRHFAPAQTGAYTWWSQRQGVRERNVGWRIDYILASPSAMPFVRSAAIHPQVMGSDHCPISAVVDPKICG